MEFLNASNNAETQLLYDIDENDTSLQVRDTDIFPKPPFLVSINDEIIKVNSVDGNTFSGLERGREGTTPAKHKAGDFVENRFTAGMYHNILDNISEPKHVKTETYDNIISLPNSATNGQVSVGVEGLTVSNLLGKDGDFARGTVELADGWHKTSNIRTSYNTEEKAQEFNYLYHDRYIYYIADFKNGHKYYIRFLLKKTKEEDSILIIGFHRDVEKALENTIRIKNKDYSTDQYTEINKILRPTESWDFIGFTGYGRTNCNAKIKDMSLIDLTETFGEGNEPTAEQCKQIFNGHISGTKSTIGSARISSADDTGEVKDKAYVTAKKDGKIVNLNRINEEIYDEIDLNKGMLIKRTGKLLLDGTENWVDRGLLDNGLRRFSLNSKITYKSSGPDVIEIYCDTLPVQPSIPGVTTARDRGICIYRANSNAIYLTLNDGETPQTILSENPATLIYQLAEPEIIPVCWTGLQGYENGTVYFDTVIPEIGFYCNNGLETHSPEHPIKEVDTLYKVDKETGLRTPLDTSKCEIRSDRLSFSHPDLQDGDLCDWDYIPTTESTNGKKTIVAPTNISAAVSGLLKDSEIQKENIRQVGSRIDAHEADKANPHNTNKFHVGLGNVDNVKQMPISGGILENYSEKLITLSGTNPVINLSEGNNFKHTLSGNTTYTIKNAVSGSAHSFTLIVTQTSTPRTITFPSSIKWQGGEIPDLTTASKTYILTFITVNGGTTWLGMFGGEF